MKYFLLTGAAVLLAHAGPASAADAAKSDQDPWTGIFIGAGIALADGYADANVFDGNRDILGDFDSIAINEQSFASRALSGTLEAGADLRVGNRLVAGIGASYDFGKTKGQLAADFSNGDSVQASAFDRDRFAAYGRLGILLNDHALVYGLAGWGHMRWEAEGSANGGSARHESGSEDGLVLGGGMEALLGRNLSLKLEYRFEDYGKIASRTESQEFDAFHGPSDAISSYIFEPTVQTVRAVVSYRLGVAGNAGGEDTLGDFGFASGFHAGLGGGITALQQQARFDVTDSTGDSGRLTFKNFGAADPFGSVEAGYDHVFENGFVAGLAGDFSYTQNADNFDIDNHEFLHERTHVTGGFTTDYGIALTARAGFLIAPDTLIYGVGGIGSNHVEGDFQVDTDNGLGSPTNSSTYTLDKWTPAGIVGAGIETMAGENWSVKLEYRHLVFADARDTVFDDGDTTVHADLSSLSDQIRAIVSYRLN